MLSRQQIRSFLTVVEEGSIHRAGARLRMSTLTRQIRLFLSCRPSQPAFSTQRRHSTPDDYRSTTVRNERMRQHAKDCCRLCTTAILTQHYSAAGRRPIVGGTIMEKPSTIRSFARVVRECDCGLFEVLGGKL